MQIYVTSGHPVATVLCFHQCNWHINRKLWERRAHKYNPCVGAKNPQTCADRESTRFYAVQYMSNEANLRIFGAPYRHGTVFPRKQFAHQKEALGKESPKI